MLIGTGQLKLHEQEVFAVAPVPDASQIHLQPTLLAKSACRKQKCGCEAKKSPRGSCVLNLSHRADLCAKCIDISASDVRCCGPLRHSSLRLKRCAGDVSGFIH